MKRLLLVSIVCLAAGVAGGFYASQTFGATLFSGMTDIDGVVVDKEKEGSRLVLAIESKSGHRVLAMFTKRRADVDQLVNEGDRITVRLPRDRTLADNPPIVRVIKPGEEAEGAHTAAREESAPRPVRYSYGLPLDAGVHDAGLTTPHVETREPTEVAAHEEEDDEPEDITVAELLARATRASDGALVIHAGETAEQHSGPPATEQRPAPTP